MNSRFKLLVVTSSTFLVVLLLLGAAMGQSASPDDAYRHLSVYTEVLSRIKSEYVEEPDIKNVTLGAMNGMLEAIDPFSSYLSAEQYKQYLKAQDAKKSGVGLALSRKFGYVGVVNVVPGSAAWKSGLTTGDMLESINGVATRDMPLAYAEMLLMGENGTNVEVSVLRVRKPEPQKITLTRGPVRLPSVTSRMLPDNIGLVQAPALGEGRVKEVANQIETLQKQGAKRYILDLRNSGFGKPDDGVALADLFIEKGTITYLEGQKVKREDRNAEPSAILKGQPLVVITNRGTANAAELAAAALLDNKRAEVVGEKTYGDAAVRKAITMDDGSAVLLAVAKYYSPSGKALMEGVTPSVAVTDNEPVVEAEEEEGQPQTQAAPAPPEPKKDEDDTLLKKAVEVLTKGKSDTAKSTGAAAPQAGLPEQPKPLTIEKK
jgi:carboxyl-terminal processing protease